MNSAPLVPPPHLGKYRGLVQNNVDPGRLGRIHALVPSLSPDPLGWALPCTPFPAAGSAFLAVPPIGAAVWIELEGGNLNFPVWTGCFWRPGEPPLLQLPE